MDNRGQQDDHPPWEPRPRGDPLDAPHEPSSHRLRKGRSGRIGEVAFVTKCLHSDRDLDLSAPRVARPIVRALLKARELGRCRLLAWCLMPDHIHIVLAPVGEGRSGPAPGMTPLSCVIGDWADASTHLVNRTLRAKGSLWQDGFHDHRLRRRERLSDLIAYVHYNPVKAGLVAAPEQWPWSTAAPEFAEATDWNWYVGNCD
jgi:REP-associated tyrosine transposase